MPQIFVTPTKNLNSVSLREYDGRELLGIAIGGVVKSISSTASDVLQVLLEEDGGHQMWTLDVSFEGTWYQKLVSRLRPHDRLYVSGAKVAITEQQASPGGSRAGPRYAARVPAPSAGDSAGASSSSSSPNSIVSIGRSQGVAIQWEPVSSSVASANSLRIASAAGRVASSAGANRIYAEPRVIGAATLDQLPDMDPEVGVRGPASPSGAEGASPVGSTGGFPAVAGGGAGQGSGGSRGSGGSGGSGPRKISPLALGSVTAAGAGAVADTAGTPGPSADLFGASGAAAGPSRVSPPVAAGSLVAQPDHAQAMGQGEDNDAFGFDDGDDLRGQGAATGSGTTPPGGVAGQAGVVAGTEPSAGAGAAAVALPTHATDSSAQAGAAYNTPPSAAAAAVPSPARGQASQASDATSDSLGSLASIPSLSGLPTGAGPAGAASPVGSQDNDAMEDSAGGQDDDYGEDAVMEAGQARAFAQAADSGAGVAAGAGSRPRQHPSGAAARSPSPSISLGSSSDRDSDGSDDGDGARTAAVRHSTGGRGGLAGVPRAPGAAGTASPAADPGLLLKAQAALVRHASPHMGGTASAASSAWSSAHAVAGSATKRGKSKSPPETGNRVQSAGAALLAAQAAVVGQAGQPGQASTGPTVTAGADAGAMAAGAAATAAPVPPAPSAGAGFPSLAALAGGVRAVLVTTAPGAAPYALPVAGHAAAGTAPAAAAPYAQFQPQHAGPSRPAGAASGVGAGSLAAMGPPPVPQYGVAAGAGAGVAFGPGHAGRGMPVYPPQIAMPAAQAATAAQEAAGSGAGAAAGGMGAVGRPALGSGPATTLHSASSIGSSSSSMPMAMAGPARQVGTRTALVSRPVRVPGCTFISDLRNQQKKVQLWAVVLNWKAPMASSGTDKFVILTVLDDSGQTASTVPEGKAKTVDMKIFHMDGATQPRPLFVGDVIFVQDAQVQVYGGDKTEVVLYKFAGGTIFHTGVPGVPLESVAAWHDDPDATTMPAMSHFGAMGHKSVDGRPPGINLQDFERQRLRQLQAFWASLADQAKGTVDRRGFMRTLAECRAEVSRSTGDRSVFVDLLACVASYSPVYDAMVTKAAAMDKRVRECRGKQAVLDLAQRIAVNGPAPPGGWSASPEEVTALATWIRDPDKVLLDVMYEHAEASGAAGPKWRRNAVGQSAQLTLYLWDGSDPEQLYLHPDRSHVPRPSGWAGPGGQLDDTGHEVTPGLACGSILRLTIDDNLSDVVRLRLRPGDWVAVRNMKLRTDKGQADSGALDGNAGRLAVQGNSGKCGLLRVPLARAFEGPNGTTLGPLELGPAAVPNYDIRRRMDFYLKSVYNRLVTQGQKDITMPPGWIEGLEPGTGSSGVGAGASSSGAGAGSSSRTTASRAGAGSSGSSAGMMTTDDSYSGGAGASGRPPIGASGSLPGAVAPHRATSQATSQGSGWDIENRPTPIQQARHAHMVPSLGEAGAASGGGATSSLAAAHASGAAATAMDVDVDVTGEGQAQRGKRTSPRLVAPTNAPAAAAAPAPAPSAAPAQAAAVPGLVPLPDMTREAPIEPTWQARKRFGQQQGHDMANGAGAGASSSHPHNGPGSSSSSSALPVPTAVQYLTKTTRQLPPSTVSDILASLRAMGPQLAAGRIKPGQCLGSWTVTCRALSVWPQCPFELCRSVAEITSVQGLGQAHRSSGAALRAGSSTVPPDDFEFQAEDGDDGRGAGAGAGGRGGRPSSKGAGAAAVATAGTAGLSSRPKSILASHTVGSKNKGHGLDPADDFEFDIDDEDENGAGAMAGKRKGRAGGPSTSASSTAAVRAGTKRSAADLDLANGHGAGAGSSSSGVLGSSAKRPKPGLSLATGAGTKGGSSGAKAAAAAALRSPATDGGPVSPGRGRGPPSPVPSPAVLQALGNAKSLFASYTNSWAYDFRLRVYCMEGGPKPGPKALVQARHVLDLQVLGHEADALLPGLPACDLLHNPATLNGLVDRLTVLLRDDVAMEVGVAAFYMPGCNGTSGAAGKASGGGPGLGKASSSGKGSSHAQATQGSDMTGASQLDPGADLLSNVRFLLVSTAGVAPPEGAVPGTGRLCGPDCKCQERLHKADLLRKQTELDRKAGAGSKKSKAR